MKVSKDAASQGVWLSFTDMERSNLMAELER